MLVVWFVVVTHWSKLTLNKHSDEVSMKLHLRVKSSQEAVLCL